MPKKSHKYCIVPMCTSTSIKTPNKTFVTLPKAPKVRKQWQMAMKRVEILSNHSTYFVCEDHFNLEEDMQNYLYFKLMEKVQIKMKPDVLPHIFDCKITRTQTHSKQFRSAFLKRQRHRILDENFCNPGTSKKSREDGDVHEAPDLANSNLEEIHVKRCTKKIQVNIKPKMVSKKVQCRLQNRRKKTLEIKPYQSTSFTSSSSTSIVGEVTSSSGSFQCTSESSFGNEVAAMEQER
ncbi:hypothetical protein RI129_006578 [Pyrocoelia pectoralis]|uniref:THAP-type domain-containing protein n=1 Tax=Pyrocoelia pectoralis TaxID=417401 RepID=A0AAN7ZNY8_9COLE